MPSDWRDKDYPGKWRSVADFRALLEQAQPAVNAVLLTGHGALRIGVAGYCNRPLTGSEQRGMVRLFEQCLAEGSHGLSTGLIYNPGAAASSAEIAELARIAARHDGVYTTHMRSEGKGLLQAIDEALDIGRQSGVRLQISHLKVSGRANWPMADEALDRIRGARRAGMPVAADRYPYTAGATELDVIFPAWLAEGGTTATLKRLEDSSDRARLRAELERSRSEQDWSAITIGSTFHPDNAAFRGCSLDEVADRLGLGPVDAVLHLAATDRLKTGAFFGGMDPHNMRRILAEPYVMIGSDASLRAPEGPLSHDFPHPRAYGTFPRYLRLVLDEALLDLPEAIRKVTSLPADQFGLSRRGRLRNGDLADVVVLDPVRLKDRADYGSPHRLAEGVRHVLVNGVPTLRDGLPTGNRAGRVL
jgi:N-acyl-D-amino-acid deacylase